MLYKCGNAKVRLYKMWDNYNFWNHETSATYMIYDKGSSNMMKYLTNIVYGIKGLELMTGIGCCAPSYCLVPTIGLGCHCCYCHSHLYPPPPHHHYYRICFYYDSIRIIRAIFRILLQI